MRRVLCNNCKTEYEDDPAVQPKLQKPCPSCGSTSRTFFQNLEGQLTFSSKLGFKGRHSGKRKPFIWGIIGTDLFRKINKWVHLERIFDKDNDRYKEEITDPSTGEIIHRCEESLSKHQGHGSAKNKTDKTN
jgi:hypothetical protein